MINLDNITTVINTLKKAKTKIKVNRQNNDIMIISSEVNLTQSELIEFILSLDKLDETVGYVDEFLQGVKCGIEHKEQNTYAIVLPLGREVYEARAKMTSFIAEHNKLIA